MNFGVTVSWIFHLLEMLLKKINQGIYIQNINNNMLLGTIYPAKKTLYQCSAVVLVFKHSSCKLEDSSVRSESVNQYYMAPPFQLIGILLYHQHRQEFCVTSVGFFICLNLNFVLLVHFLLTKLSPASPQSMSIIKNFKREIVVCWNPYRGFFIDLLLMFIAAGFASCKVWRSLGLKTLQSMPIV